MKDHGTVRSVLKPAAVEVKETKVFAASDITEITVTMEEQEVTEYEYNLVEYEKDEYIQNLTAQMETTQEALDFLLMA